MSDPRDDSGSYSRPYEPPENPRPTASQPAPTVKNQLILFQQVAVLLFAIIAYLGIAGFMMWQATRLSEVAKRLPPRAQAGQYALVQASMIASASAGLGCLMSVAGLFAVRHRKPGLAFSLLGASIVIMAVTAFFAKPG